LFQRADERQQTSGETCREIANLHPAVIARESGRSSIPEMSLIEPISRSVLDAPPSRGMTALGGGDEIWISRSLSAGGALRQPYAAR
jgi:hypothetical protein